jgi:oligopeptide transport system substrate-binding protein
MKKICILLALCVLLTSCGLISPNKNTGENKTFNFDLSINPRTLDPQTAAESDALIVIRNIFTPLLTIDSDGQLLPCAATSWETNGEDYTFHLRDDLIWKMPQSYLDTLEVSETTETTTATTQSNTTVVTSATSVSTTAYTPPPPEPVTAHDFVFAFRRLISPKTKSPLADKFMGIKNALAVYQGRYASESALAVEAVDDYTLKITLEYPDSNFLYLMTGAYPCNEPFYLYTAGRYGLSREFIPSCGAFYISDWVYDAYSTEGNLLRIRRFTDSPFSALPLTVNFFPAADERLGAFTGGETDAYIANCTEFGALSKYSYAEYPVSVWGFVFNPMEFGSPSDKTVLASAIMQGNFVSDIPEQSGFVPASRILPPALSAYNIYTPPTFPKNEPLTRYYSEILLPESAALREYADYVNQEWQKELSFYCNIKELPESEYQTALKRGNYEIAAVKIKGETAAVYLAKITALAANSGTYPETTLLERGLFIPLAYETEYFISAKSTRNIVYDPFTGTIDFARALKF